MNTTTNPPSTADTAVLDDLRAIFAAQAAADQERRPYIDACIDAGRRLARWAWAQRYLSDQAETIAAALASIYNGGDAAPVRLDELRWLDWPHQRDLVAVMVGTGFASTPDTHIRDAFRAAGGQPAVEWLHQHVLKGQ